MITSFKSSLPLLGSLLVLEEQKIGPQNSLKLRIVLIQRTLEALKAFEEKKLSQFDAIVGDQACQIRALKVCFLSREKDLQGEIEKAKRLCNEQLNAISRLNKNLLALEQECERGVSEIKMQKRPLVEENSKIGQERLMAIKSCKENGLTVRDIDKIYASKFAGVKKKHVQIDEDVEQFKIRAKNQQYELVSSLDNSLEVDPRIIFLAQSYFLNLVKKRELVPKDEFGNFNSKDKTNIGQFNTGINSLNNTMSQVVAKAKKAVADQSVVFVQEEYCLLRSERAYLLKNRVSILKPIYNTDKIIIREELPFFYITKVIFQRTIEENIQVLLKVRNKRANPLDPLSFKAKIAFIGNQESGKFDLLAMDKVDTNAASIVIEGISEKTNVELRSDSYITELLDRAGGLMEIINLNASQHSQFTDQKIVSNKIFDDIPKIEPEEKQLLISKREEAYQKGFARENCTALVIDHIFCDLIKNQLDNG